MCYKSEIPCLLDSQGQIVSDSTSKAELLNNYFFSVFTVDDGLSQDWLIPEPENLLESVQISPNQVYHKLKNLAPKLSCGPDNIPSIVFKHCAAELSVPLAKIFNISIETGKLPQIWHDSVVTAIHKKGPTSLVQNYRPISLTCVACRVLESIIGDSIKSHLSDVIFEGQHGFLAKKSTVTQLFETYEEWVSAIDDSSSIDMVFIDFAKAFDTVCHNKLLSKLYQYGVRGKLLNWVKDFLRNRTQRVKVDSKLSNPANVSSSVPQGSVLGPLLFLIFINDLSYHMDRRCKIKLFADDLKIYVIYDHNEGCFPVALQSTLNAVLQWAKNSQLSIQNQKCAVMHIGRNNPHINYFFGTEAIPVAQSVRDLGVMMTASLTFNQHIENICKSANTTANLILKTFKHKRPSFMCKMFNAFVRPKVEYASAIWNPHHKTLINRLEKVQRRFTKRLPGLSKMPYANRLTFLKIPPLELRRLHLDLTFLYKILRGHFNISRQKYFQFKHNRTRGNSWALAEKHSNKDLQKYSFAQRIVKIWNFLPEEVVSCATVPAFKKLLHSVDLGRFLRGDGLLPGQPGNRRLN